MHLIEIQKKSSIENRIIYDLQTLHSQRKKHFGVFLHDNYPYNISIKRGQDFLLNHVDSKLSLVVMYADLVGSTKMSMALPVERMAKIIKAFLMNCLPLLKVIMGLY